MHKPFSLSSLLIQTIIIVLFVVFAGNGNPSYAQTIGSLKDGFQNPPPSARPGVYWYFMDGNMTKASITEDLESMKNAGIGNLVFLEVNVGIPRGPVDFLSEEWRALFTHAVKEAERLGIEITLGIGPGWTGSGGPWVKPEQSMQHLVSSSVTVQGGTTNKIILQVPPPKEPFFGEETLTPELKKEWNDFYEDVAVLAYPTPLQQHTLADADEKALYYRAPYSSQPNVKQYLPATTDSSGLNGATIDKNKIIDITGKLHNDGTLEWTPPAGNWTIMRFGKRNNGAITRPAPVPGLGFECDKFDTVALNDHLNHYIGRLLENTGNPKDKHTTGGLKRLHMDSWEMGAQNWTGKFREDFIKRRGYDPLPFYPVYAGNIVENTAISERFLWDLRQTAQELVLENHALQVKRYAHRNGMDLSIEPYDMNPTADLELGNIADVPMAEFWSKGYGFNTTFSCIEATSLAHVNGRPLVPAEAFTAQNNEGWKQYPGAMKNQGDWAFAAGINRFVFHTFQNQFLPDSLRPGATMGPYGVQWNRNQTWWPMVSSYHQYLSRCQYLLQQGKSVADILYLIPEQAPYVFLPPASAMTGSNDTLPDRKGYNFDGCSPSQLYSASVQNGMIVFPGGGSYRLLVLPAVKTMTPALLQKITELVKDGATVIGAPPVQSPGLSDYPACDGKLRALATLLWGNVKYPQQQIARAYGKGKVIWGGELGRQINNVYPEYDLTATILQSMGVKQDFHSDGPVRYTHRSSADWDMYFVANTSDKVININTFYRTVKGNPQLWNPLTGEISNLTKVSNEQCVTKLPLQLDAYQSYFIVFTNTQLPVATRGFTSNNKVVTTLNGPWQVSFDPKWGGPKQVQFDTLTDWTVRPEEGIKYYSGMAVYHKTFDLPLAGKKGNKLLLNLGEVKNMARVKLNGKDVGVVWTAPWEVDITNAVKEKNNQLEIEVVNLWPNRLIGDERLPDDGIKDGEWPDWLTSGTPRPSKRFTFTTFRHYAADSPLLPSGLIGPVTVQSAAE